MKRVAGMHWSHAVPVTGVDSGIVVRHWPAAAVHGSVMRPCAAVVACSSEARHRDAMAQTSAAQARTAEFEDAG